jgi:hypothetical protein
MATAPLPVRFEGSSPGASLTLDPSRTAFMVVDCDGDLGAARNAVVEERIAPALRAARGDGMRVFYFYEASYGVGGPLDVANTLRHAWSKPPLAPPGWKPAPRPYRACIVPREDEPELPKDNRDGFAGVHADRFLKSWASTRSWRSASR